MENVKTNKGVLSVNAHFLTKESSVQVSFRFSDAWGTPLYRRYKICCLYGVFVWTIKLITIYYINTNEIPGELSRENMISSHVKITCYLHT